MTKKLTIVVSQGREGPSSRQKIEHDLACALGDWPNVDVIAVPHLVDLAHDGPTVRRLRSIAGDMIVLGWLYPRAAFWVLRAFWIEGRMGRTSWSPEEETPADSAVSPAAEDAPVRTIWCLDLREFDGLESLLAEIERIAAESTVEAMVTLGHGESAAEHAAEPWEPTQRRWYPVIDYSRCGNCLECLNFCLFGVFALDESDQVVVDQPDACRDGCPACSRVCPSHAILFPRHHSPAIAGDAEAPAEEFDVDLVQLLGAASVADLAAPGGHAPKPAGSGPTRPAERDDLDQLVDDLDQLDL